MEGYIFELEYTDHESGELVYRDVAELGIAQQLAKELAKASGRRAVIRRKRNPQSTFLWSVHLADAQTGELECVWSGLTKREVLMRWRLWKEQQTDCALIAWPEWMPPLQMSLPSVAA